MRSLETLSTIKDSDAVDNIRLLTACFVERVKPLKVVLFGSFANGTYTDESDYDFYIVMGDDTKDLADVTTRAYRSIRRLKRRPVDIVIGTESRFDERKHLPTVENEVFRKGVLLYG